MGATPIIEVIYIHGTLDGVLFSCLSIFFFFINNIKKNSSQVGLGTQSLRSQNLSLELHNILEILTSTILRSSVYVLVYIR